MTPYEIGVLLWYYARVEDHPDFDRKPPIWEPTIQSFFFSGLVSIKGSPDVMFALTDKGMAYVDALQQVPLPVAVWTTRWPK